MEDAEFFLIPAQIGRKTGNLKAAMDVMVHSDVKIAITYNTPELEIVRGRNKITAHFTAHRGNRNS